MRVHELLAALTNRPNQNAEVLVVESGAADTILTIESVMKEGNEKSLILMGKSLKPGTLIEASQRGAGQIHNTKIYKSAEQPGKFQVSIDGLTLLKHFETQTDAHTFIQGFVFGFSAGSGSKTPEVTV